MKRYLYIIILCLLPILFVGCRDEEVDVTIIKETIVSPDKSSALVKIYVENMKGKNTQATISSYGVYLSKVNKTPNEKDQKYIIKDSDSNFSYTYGRCSLTISGLDPSTTYYICPFVRNSLGSITGNVVSFTTDGTANVKTKEASDITANSAKLHGSITKTEANVTIQKIGFFVSTNSSPSNSNYIYKATFQKDIEGDFYTAFSDLENNTKYYYRAYIVVDDDIKYGEILNFRTHNLHDAISLSIEEATDITSSSAKVSGTITIGDDAKGKISECGFICSTDSKPTHSSTWWKSLRWTNSVSTWSGEKNISGTFEELESNTTFYYRLYYKVGDQYYYGNSIKKFKTLEAVQTNSYYTVFQIISIFSQLPSGARTDDTYIVRGYVTQWNNGYPEYSNGDFWINDSMDGNPNTLRCYRITGVNNSDKRQLVPGEYVEVRDCYIYNYNGQAELQGGSYTIIN